MLHTGQALQSPQGTSRQPRVFEMIVRATSEKRKSPVALALVEIKCAQTRNKSVWRLAFELLLSISSRQPGA